MAPDIQLNVLGGGRARLAELRGRPVVVNFWASWCTPCRSELPAIIEAYQTHRERGLAVLAVNLTDQEKRSDIQRFVAELQIPFPVLLDERGRTRRRYGLISLPTTVFVDSAGLVRGVHSGPITRRELSRGLAGMLTVP